MKVWFLRKDLRLKMGFFWRCDNFKCLKYRNRYNIRVGSFFKYSKLSILKTLKCLIRWSTNQPQHSIINSLMFNHKTYTKIIQKFLGFLCSFDFKDNKLGGPGKLVQIDETGLKFKVKSH